MWRNDSVFEADLLKMILSFKTKQASVQPIVERAIPLKKDIEERKWVQNGCLLIWGGVYR